MSWFLRQRIGREVIKALLRPLLRWGRMDDPIPGFSVVLGAPWALRHILPANLRFVERMDLAGLHRIYVVFDRTPQPGAATFIQGVKAAFPAVPLEFRFHPLVAGSILHCVNQAHFYASLNWIVGVQACRTRYAVLHDFDLYPVDPRMFVEVVRALRERGLRFSGTEIRMDKEWFAVVDPPTIGSCELGIDVAWLKEKSHPVDTIRKAERIGGVLCMFDSWNYVQLRTPARAVAEGLGRHSYVHVDNLCATFLDFTAGRKYQLAWRLPCLWYLEGLCGPGDHLDSMTKAMLEARSPQLRCNGRVVDFSSVHVTCSNVLRDKVQRMETALFGGCRPEADAYVASFHRFLERHGDNHDLLTR